MATNPYSTSKGGSPWSCSKSKKSYNKKKGHNKKKY